MQSSSRHKVGYYYWLIAYSYNLAASVSLSKYQSKLIRYGTVNIWALITQYVIFLGENDMECMTKINLKYMIDIHMDPIFN